MKSQVHSSGTYRALFCTAQTVDHRLSWVAALAVFPVMYGIYCSYVTYFSFAVQTLKTTPLARAAGAGAC